MGHVRGNNNYRMPMSPSASTLLCLLIRFTTTDPVLSEGSFRFTHPIQNIATGREHVVVATEDNLHLFNHRLDIEALRHPGSHDGRNRSCEEKEDASQVYYNKILLVYNDIVLSCWNKNSGACREYSVNNLTLLKGYGDEIVSCNPEHTAAGFIFQKANKIYFVTAAPSKRETSGTRTVVIREKGDGDIFTYKDKVELKTVSTVLNIVDAFEWKGKFIFPYYPSNEMKARLVVLDCEDSSLSFNSQYNLTCGTETQRGVILSSFAFASSGSFFWAGIFSTNNSASLDKTALCIYNITLLENRSKGCIYTDFNVNNDFTCENYDNPLPIHSKPTISHGDLTSVYVMEVQKTLVLFLGTGNGQLLKVTLDSNYTASCPEVLHEFEDEAAVFKTMHLDPVNDTYLYVATVNEIKRVRIAKCEQYQSCNECLTAADPHCGWCQLEKRCTMKAECSTSTLLENWIEKSEEYGKCFGIHVISADKNQITISLKKNPSLLGRNSNWSCEFQKEDTREVLCKGTAGQRSLNCSCPFKTVQSSDRDVLTAKAASTHLEMLEHFQFNNCSQYSQSSCLECISNGCLYCISESKCKSPLTPCAAKADETDCKTIEHTAAIGPSCGVKIQSVYPYRITYAGKRNVLITGENLKNLTRLFLVGTSSCKPQEVQIKKEKHWNDTHAFISLPVAKEVKQLCVQCEGRCQQGPSIFYVSLPTCSVNDPNVVWLSGGRKLSLSGKNLELVDTFSIKGNTFYKDIKCQENKTHCYFIAEPLSETSQILNISIHVEGTIVKCGTVHSKPDPVFTTFTAIDVGDAIELSIRKEKDELHIRADEIQVSINSNITCKVRNITEWSDRDIIFCKTERGSTKKIDVTKIEVEVVLGNYTKKLDKVSGTSLYIFILLVIPLLLVVVIATCVITRRKSSQLSEQQRRKLEQLECDIRQEIRDGFAEFQMDREIVNFEALGTIPFFDYKHFALKTFFPESDGNRQDLSEKLCENVPSPFQKNPRIQTDENDAVTILKNLFQNQGFLVLVIHTLEKQKDFSVKDRCLFASFLTITFQNNLLYLTGLLDTLIKDLIEQSSNKNPKLMLRRTETVVEKLLTNWMATCLYGFLRESVGEPLYGLVCTLNQRIHKGPIDAITSKALYTLNEDWLLWQMTDFSNVDINVYYPTPESEAVDDASPCIKVTVLDCDTIGQVKEKILQTFQSKNGYAFSFPPCDICLELHYGQTYKELLDIDASSVVMENGFKRLNTVKHYKIESGTTIKIVLRKNCDPAKQYSSDYVHLELPEFEESDDLQNMGNKGKQKFKVKEMYLTKLLSTKVTIHSSVEKLFHSIWTISQKPPIAIKYFFDFLDTQGEIRKISDPDVLHIWKTNSLPLRFWVNILKNPQFVLDIKKTALLESCLSVIAQAFMDGFSLTEQQLGKSAPTNKLLYAKDIPQFKEEIRSFYKNIRDAPSLSSTELTEFLTSESKKHEHEFKDDVAILELYKYIEKYNDVILSILEKETGFDSEVKQLLNLQKLSNNKKMCSWE
ncbi:plexin-C1 [Rana temporaria]|uniref:plexin-C1 n=1 Tax=Rana temporaria TaxID=8407 RepID=UPI001AAE159E|nr:plexin-C1 [Rana temporaria]